MQLLAPNLACPGNPLLNELTGTFKDKNDENLDAESIGKHKNKIDDKTQDGEKSQRSSRKRRGPDQTPERKAVPPAEFSRLLAAVGSSQANPEECASPPKKLRLDDRDQEKVNCAKELISTEETYVQALERLQEVFLTPLVTKAKEWGVLAADAEQLQAAIRPIYEFHGRTFLNSLQKAGPHAIDAIAKAFSMYGRCFVLYTTYMINYDKTMLALKRCCASKKFAEYQQSALTKCNGLNLEAHLIMPVQRIPRFELLLGRLLEATPRDHADYFELEKAIAVVRDVVKKINEQKRESEATAKLLFLEQNVKGLPKNLRFAHKRLIREGIALVDKEQCSIYVLQDALMWVQRGPPLRLKGYVIGPAIHTVLPVGLDVMNCYYAAAKSKPTDKERKTIAVSFDFHENTHERDSWVADVNSIRPTELIEKQKQLPKSELHGVFAHAQATPTRARQEDMSSVFPVKASKADSQSLAVPQSAPRALASRGSMSLALSSYSAIRARGPFAAGLAPVTAVPSLPSSIAPAPEPLAAVTEQAPTNVVSSTAATTRLPSHARVKLMQAKSKSLRLPGTGKENRSASCAIPTALQEMLKRHADAAKAGTPLAIPDETTILNALNTNVNTDTAPSAPGDVVNAAADKETAVKLSFDSEMSC